MDKREKNVAIFRDTMQWCGSSERLKKAIERSNSTQYVISDQEEPKHRFSTPAQVLVSPKRSFEAARAYARAEEADGDVLIRNYYPLAERKAEKVCVLNFASATNPGGGVTRGSNAQEEALCRCSTLYSSLSDKKITGQFHDLHRSLLGVDMDATYNDDCIYTPGVVVFKADTDSPEILPEDQWYEVDVITCAAPNLRERPSNAMNPGSGSGKPELTDAALLELHIRRISKIMDIAKREKEDVVILGAFGCGAFRNPPRIVAEAMARVVEEYRYDFKVIEFAVYCPPDHTENYDVFEERMRELLVHTVFNDRGLTVMIPVGPDDCIKSEIHADRELRGQAADILRELYSGEQAVSLDFLDLVAFFAGKSSLEYRCLEQGEKIRSDGEALCYSETETLAAATELFDNADCDKRIVVCRTGMHANRLHIFTEGVFVDDGEKRS